MSMRTYRFEPRAQPAARGGRTSVVAAAVVQVGAEQPLHRVAEHDHQLHEPRERGCREVGKPVLGADVRCHKPPDLLREDRAREPHLVRAAARRRPSGERHDERPPESGGSVELQVAVRVVHAARHVAHPLGLAVLARERGEARACSLVEVEQPDQPRLGLMRLVGRRRPEMKAGRRVRAARRRRHRGFF